MSDPPRVRLPHPLVLLLGGVLLAAALTWVLPPGEFDRRDDPATGRQVVVAGTYRAVEPAPVGLLGAAVAVPRGIVAAGEIIAVILLVGGAWSILDRTGALARLAGSVVRRFRRRAVLAIAAGCLVFSTFGALENMHEEILPLIPVLLVLGAGLGFDAVTVVALSLGAAVVGSAFGPTNPFQAGIALKLAELPLLSGGGLRTGMWAAATLLWIAWTAAHARRHRAPAADPAPGDEPPELEPRDGAMLALMVAPFAAYVYGALALDWGFNELSGLFLVAGALVGLLGRLGAAGTTAAYLEGMKDLLPAALLVGVARSISVVLTDGRVIDTILSALAAPLDQVPAVASAALMVPAHALLHVAVPSVSGQAVLTMPVMIPLADLLGLSRQAAILAYQTGAGLADMLSPTNGAMLAILLAAGTRYGAWLRFAVPGALLMAAVGLAGIAAVVWLGAA